jgi:hypothetical protein
LSLTVSIRALAGPAIEGSLARRVAVIAEACRVTLEGPRPDERTYMTLLNRGDDFPSIELRVAGAGVPSRGPDDR